MSKDLEDKIANLLLGRMGDAFNRSLGALESAGAISTKEMRKHYKGVGSKYYDMVTAQMLITVEYAKADIHRIVGEYEAQRNSQSSK